MRPKTVKEFYWRIDILPGRSLSPQLPPRAPETNEETDRRQKMYIRPLWWMSSKGRAARRVQRDWSEDTQSASGKQGARYAGPDKCNCAVKEGMRWDGEREWEIALPDAARKVDCPAEAYIYKWISNLSSKKRTTLPSALNPMITVLRCLFN